ncbi:MAG: PEP-CTERM sorting domain-containing protein, partial [Sphingomonas sp.]
GWNSPATETAVYGGTAGITGTAPRNGDGSVELTGPRSRFVLGSLYGYAGVPSMGSLSDMRSLTFDWQLATDDVSNYSPDYTPALRFTIFDGTSRKELIWEGVYNGTYGNTTKGTWYTSGVNDKFYITGGTGNDGKSIADWASDGTLAGYNVIGVSAGHGGGAGTGFHAFVDNITVAGVNGTTTYNFNVTDPVSAVPEPASWAMLIGGFGVMGGTLRTRARKVRFA